MMSQGNALFSRAFRPKKKESTPLTVKIEKDLADRVQIMKTQMKQQTGRYFSVTSIVEAAIEVALHQAQRELDDGHRDDDEITIL